MSLGRYMLRAMDQEPMVFVSCVLATTGFFMPFVVLPIREAMGYEVGMVRSAVLHHVAHDLFYPFLQ